MNIEPIPNIISSVGASTIAKLKRFEKIEPPEKSLLQAVRAGARDIIAVTMDEGKAVRVIPGQIKTLFTYALGGCQATLILAKCKDGNPLAILTHFAPIHVGANLNRLGQLIKEHRSMIDTKSTPKVFFSAPGEWVKKGEKYERELVPRSTEIVNNLRLGLKAHLGSFEETILPYSEKIEFGESRALIANFAKDSSNKVSIQAVGGNYKNIAV